eukprot:CAMPEP_0115266944 /NCGR_PEP_ID=MMETSP0270-20121206/51732_2 /TAXON_ID=71861 /ORGANISM="Scrippsiella trochoidea, Strain CCMP3099" /LENGTH=159 /DNA_ID=CAMNT_0002683063 /DNA_START=63 /DNA_END=540 /DNA_ORIENTATION=-
MGGSTSLPPTKDEARRRQNGGSSVEYALIEPYKEAKVSPGEVPKPKDAAKPIVKINGEKLAGQMRSKPRGLEQASWEEEDNRHLKSSSSSQSGRNVLGLQHLLDLLSVEVAQLHHDVSHRALLRQGFRRGGGAILVADVRQQGRHDADAVVHHLLAMLL